VIAEANRLSYAHSLEQTIQHARNLGAFHQQPVTRVRFQQAQDACQFKLGFKFKERTARLR
jgi:hypothetical protein